jgi:hypothetical protein
MDAFVQRWRAADDSEGSFLTRALDQFTVRWDLITSAGMRGFGLGVGTNMAAKLMTGDVGFQLAELEWQRVVLEMGAPLGLVYIAWRISLSAWIAAKCISAMARKDILPPLLFAAVGLTILDGQTGVPATLGYLALASGLALASAESHQVFKLRYGLLKRSMLSARPQGARSVRQHL